MIPPLNYLTWGMILLFVVYSQRQLHWRGLLYKYRKYYLWFSYLSLVILTILVFGGLNYSGNPIFWRAVENGNFHHTLSWIAVFLILWRFGYNDILKGLGAAGGFIVAHETLSITTAIITGSTGVSVGESLYLYSTFIFLLIATFLFYQTFAKTTNHALLKTTVLMGVFFVFWGSIGNVSTINLLGATPYFTDPDVNLIEILGWMIPAVFFILHKESN